MACNFTYNGLDFQSFPYHDCRDSCANFPAGNEPEECLDNVEPCDYYIFVGDTWSMNETSTGDIGTGKLLFNLSIFPSLREGANVGKISKFNLSFDLITNDISLIGLSIKSLMEIIF